MENLWTVWNFALNLRVWILPQPNSQLYLSSAAQHATHYGQNWHFFSKKHLVFCLPIQQKSDSNTYIENTKILVFTFSNQNMTYWVIFHLEKRKGLIIFGQNLKKCSHSATVASMSWVSLSSFYCSLPWFSWALGCHRSL